MTKKLNYYRATLATLSQEDINFIMDYIKGGAGAHGIHCETPFTIKQINAVFALYWSAIELPPFTGPAQGAQP